MSSCESKSTDDPQRYKSCVIDCRGALNIDFHRESKLMDGTTNVEARAKITWISCVG